MAHTHSLSREERGQINMRVTFVGAVFNFFLVLVKLIVGLLGHSQALVADAIHSLSDLLNDFGLMLAMHFSRQAPDEEHPYGHERFETLAALAIGTTLAINGAWVALHNAQRLYSGEILTPESYTLIAAAIGVLVKEAMYHYTIRVARLTRSPALRANAWDHRSDAISSVIVFIGIGGSLLGFPYLDAMVAILVGVIIVRVGLMAAWEALQELVDRGLDQADLQRLREIINGVEGVTDLHLLKTRRMGHQVLAEVHIQVAPYLSVSEGHQIAERVRRALLAGMPGLGEATIHIDSEDDEAGGELLPPRSEIEARLRATLRDRGLPLPQAVTLHYQGEQLELDLCYPLPATGSIQDLHRLEQDIRNALAQADVAHPLRFFWHDSRGA